MKETHTPNHAMGIGKKSFINTFLILLGLMIFAALLTQVLPTGSFDRVMLDGREVIVPDSYQPTQVDYPFFMFLLAPVSLLMSPEAPSVIVIMLFILLIGGTFSILEKCGILKYLVQTIVKKFGGQKYLLLSVLCLAFMLFGSLIGLFEETLCLVPICIAISYSLGWDSFVGLGVSILATGFGFAAATFNPFTVGLAQRMVQLPLFSGLAFRIVVFIVFYIVFTGFLIQYAKKIEKNPSSSMIYQEEKEIKRQFVTSYTQTISPEEETRLKRAALAFSSVFILLILAVIASTQSPLIASILFPLIALIFLAGGIFSGLVSKYEGNVWKDVLSGIAGMVPSILLVTMAVSIKFIITQGGIMDTILYSFSNWISSANSYMTAILLFAFVMALNFFIGSATAKALLVMPIIAGLADLAGVTRQTAVLAFSFGDGFSNMLYPTNPVLMIALGFTVISYQKWFKWVCKIQLLAIALSIILLIIANAIQYGPF